MPAPTPEATGNLAVASMEAPKVSRRIEAVITQIPPPSLPPPRLPPSMPSPSLPPSSTSATASGDVHLQHAGGGLIDVRGFDGTVLNMHQAANASLNSRFTYANFTLAPDDPRATDVLEVHGSFLTEAYASFKTPIADNSGSLVLVRVRFGVEHHKEAHVSVIDMASNTEMFSRWLGPHDGMLAVGRIKVHVKKAASQKGDQVDLKVANDDWEYEISPGSYRTVEEGAIRTRIDVAIYALTDPLVSRVAPHGLIGQGFDGLHIDGKRDNYVPDSRGIFVTSAQGEGAIEGAVSDYIIDPRDPFSTKFKFARFDEVVAAPRTISRPRTPVGTGKGMMQGARLD